MSLLLTGHGKPSRVCRLDFPGSGDLSIRDGRDIQSASALSKGFSLQLE